jgi:hypothetical protein
VFLAQGENIFDEAKGWQNSGWDHSATGFADFRKDFIN